MTSLCDSSERMIRLLQAPPAVQARISDILDGKEPIAYQPDQTPPLLLNMTSAAAFLGVSRGTLWRLIQAGRLVPIEILPGSRRMRRTDLVELAAGGRQ